MPTGDLITGDWQIERGDLLVGDNTAYGITQVLGAAGAPPTVASDRALARRHGSIAGEDYLSPRSLTLTIEVVDDETATMTQKLDALSRAFGPSIDPVPTALRIPGVALGAVVTTSAHVRRRTIPIGITFSRGVARATFQLVAADPRFYGVAEKTATASPAETTAGGLTFDATFDLSFGGAISPGSMEVTNAGNFPTPFSFRIYGPVVDPVVTLSETGEALSFTKTLSTAAEWIDVDTASRTVLDQAGANAYSTLDAGSSWFDLPPGTSNVRLTRTGSGAATIAIYYSDAYV